MNDNSLNSSGLREDRQSFSTILEALSARALDPGHKDRLCLCDGTTDLTYGQVWKSVKALACSLEDRSGYVMVECTQDVAFIVTALAVQLAGLVFVPVEKGASDSRIAQIAEDSQAVLFVATEKGSAKTPDGLEIMDTGRILQLISETAADRGDAGDFLESMGLRLPGPEETAEILFSTGTTGKSKGIEISHGNNVAVAQNICGAVRMGPDNVELVPMPLSHSHGLRTTYAGLYNGSTLVFSNGVIRVKEFFRLLEDYGVTAIDMAPSILSMLFKLSKDKLGDYSGQLDYIELGSAALPEEDKLHLAGIMPGVRLYNFYGSTESGRTCSLDFNSMPDMPGCIGYPSVNAKFIFTDDQRNEIQATPENPGLMATAGPMNMKGYFHEPELTASVTGNGFIYTSDLGYRDEEGRIYYLGRQDDVINCGGVKISPEEIESQAGKFPGIRDCACIPVPDPLQGQKPKLFVSLSEEDLDMKAFKSFLREHLDSNKVPASVEVIDEIPRTYNGKLQRKKLEEREAACRSSRSNS